MAKATFHYLISLVLGRRVAMRFAISNWIYGKEGLEKSLQRLAKFKYDAVKLEG